MVEDHDGDTYRAVYTVRFPQAVYVLHCFQKKSHSGIRTPKPDVELISQRLNFELGLSHKALAGKLNGASFSELEDFISDVAREYVLALPGGEPKTIVASKLRQWKVRAPATGRKAGK